MPVQLEEHDDIEGIVLTGHADRIGPAQHDLEVSPARAETEQNDIDWRIVHAVGTGALCDFTSFAREVDGWLARDDDGE